MSVRSDTGPFAIVPEWVLDLGLSDGAVRLYNLLALYADREGSSFPSQRTLANRMGCSDRSIRTYRAELVKAGAMTVQERRRPDGGKTSNEYTILRALPVPPGTLFPVAPRKEPSGHELDPGLEPDPGFTDVNPGAGSADSSQKTPLDVLWDACEEHVQKAPVTKAARAAYAKLVRELFAAGVTPEQIKEQARRYRQHPTLGKTALSLAALAKWGSELEHRRRASAPRNGYVEEPLEVLPAEENARRMRELAAQMSGATREMPE